MLLPRTLSYELIDLGQSPVRERLLGVDRTSGRKGLLDVEHSLQHSNFSN